MYFETVDEPFPSHFGDIRPGDLKVWNGAGGVLDRCKPASRLLNVGGDEHEVPWRIFGKDCDISSFRSNFETENQRDAFQHSSSHPAMDYQQQLVDVKVEAEYLATNPTVTSSHPSTFENSLLWTTSNVPYQQLQLFAGVGDVASRTISDTFEQCHDSKAELFPSTNLCEGERQKDEVIVLDDETDEANAIAAGQQGNPIILDEEIDAGKRITLGDYQEEPIVLDDDTDEDFGFDDDDTVGDIKVPNPYLVDMMSSPEMGCDTGPQSLPLREFKRYVKSCKVEEEHNGPSAMMDHASVVSEACPWTNSKRIRTSNDDDCCSSGPLNSSAQGRRANDSKCWRDDALRDQPNVSEAVVGETKPHLQGSNSLTRANSSNNRMNKEENTAFQEILQFLGDLGARGEVFVQSSSTPSDCEIQCSISKPELTEQSTAQGTVDVVVYEPEPLGCWPEQSSGVLVEVKKETDQISAPVRELGLGPCLKDRRLIFAALRTFEQVRQQIIKDPSYGQGSPGAEVSSKRLRADLKAACLMRKKNYWLNDSNRPIGDVPGVSVGDCFRYRIEMAVIGLHRAVQAGIAVIPQRLSPYGVPVASSVVISARESDPYGDDEDAGDTVVYSGQGGLHCKTRECQDQQLTRGNLALSNSKDLKLPVRLIRGHRDQSPGSGVCYSYDGLYRIYEMEYVTGKLGKKVYKFKMQRLPGQRPYVSSGEGSPSSFVPRLVSPSSLERKEIDWAQVPNDDHPLYLEKGQA